MKFSVIKNALLRCAFTGLAFSSSLVFGSVAEPVRIESVRSVPYDLNVLGDIEGMATRLTSFVTKSGGFVQGPNGRIDLAPGAAFIFQGDVEDRGDAGRAITAFMVDLKKRYPERVTLLIGNRDLRKLLLLTEFTDQAMKKGDRRFDQFIAEVLHEDPKNHNQDRTLKFEYLFGSEMRLAELRKTNPQADVALAIKSFNDDIKPDGLFGEYLRLAQFGFVDNSTQTVAVHGAIRASNAGKIPWFNGQFQDARQWITQLNQSGHDLIVRALNGDQTALQHLEKYARNSSESVVGARFFDGNGTPEPPEVEVVDWLQAQHLKRVLVGHTPAGEFPVLARDGDFQILMSDLSYNTSKVSSAIRLKGDQLSVVTEVPGQKDVKISLRYGESSLLGLKTSGGLIVGECGGDFVAYQIGPQFSRIYKNIPALLAKQMITPSCRDLFRQSTRK